MKNGTVNSHRIVMLTYLFPPTFAGGTRQAIELAKGLRKRGVESFFIGADLEGAPAEEMVEGFKAYRVKTRDGGRRNYLRYALRVCSLLVRKRKAYEIVHFHSMRPFYFLIVLTCALLRKPIVRTITLVGNDDPLSLRRKGILLGLDGWLYRYYKYIISYSTALKKTCIRAGLPEGQNVIIPCAIDCGGPHSLFRPPVDRQEVRSLRAELGLPADSFIAIFVGHIQTRKGVDILLEAWDRLIEREDFGGRLLLLGPYDNPDSLQDKSDLERRFASMLKEYLDNSGGKKAIIRGNVDHSHVAKYFRAADCFVFPSRREGFGIVVVEAMSTGLPVICTMIPDITTDMIEDGKDGIIVDSHDPSELADAITKVKEDFALRNALSINAVRKVQDKFTLESIVEQHINVYSRVTG
jgi:glycosyltransferase involved in cell wall biosynthesis